MKFKKILVTGFDKSNLDDQVWTKIKQLSDSVIFDSSPDIDCLLSRFNKIDRKMIDSFPQLKYIGVLATGFATVDYKYAKTKKIVVCNIPGYATESVAEYTFALILEQLRDLEKAKQAGRHNDFSGNGFTASEIKGKTFGIIGLGRIGSRVAEIAMGFGANVVYWSRKRKMDLEKKGATYELIDNLLPKCNFLSLHLNRTTETEEIINEKRVKAIKKGSIFVNVSPMELISLKALERRLKKDDITFIFDHPDEMEKEDVDRLSQFKNCIIYPPIGFVTKEARVLKQHIFLTNLENFLKGKPTNKVN